MERSVASVTPSVHAHGGPHHEQGRAPGARALASPARAAPARVTPAAGDPRVARYDDCVLGWCRWWVTRFFCRRLEQ